MPDSDASAGNTQGLAEKQEISLSDSSIGKMEKFKLRLRAVANQVHETRIEEQHVRKEITRLRSLVDQCDSQQMMPNSQLATEIQSLSHRNRQTANNEIVTEASSIPDDRRKLLDEDQNLLEERFDAVRNSMRYLEQNLIWLRHRMLSLREENEGDAALEMASLEDDFVALKDEMVELEMDVRRVVVMV